MTRKVFLRLWRDDRHFVLARSQSLHQKIGLLLLRAEPPYRRIFRHLRDAALLPESNLGPAVAAAWSHLARRASHSERAEMLLAAARNPAFARLRLHSLARKYGDPVLLSSRLFMSPTQVNRVWIEGKAGWSLYSVYGRRAGKRPLWFIAQQLAAIAHQSQDAYRFGDVLRLLERRPYGYFELARELGQHWHHAARELARCLLIYPLQGKYYLNARMAPGFREIYEDALARGVRITSRRWVDGKCEIRYNDHRHHAIRLDDLVGGLYDLAGVLGGKDAYGLRSILRYLKGARTFTEEKLRLESGRGSVGYPLQRLLDQGLIVRSAGGRYRVAVPLDAVVRHYEKLLKPRPAGPRTGALLLAPS